MRKGLTEVVFILDRSGSMSGLEADTIGGFNSMIEKQRKEAAERRTADNKAGEQTESGSERAGDSKGLNHAADEAYVSVVLFDDSTEVLYDRVPLNKVEPMNDRQYYVRGCTALLDAIGGAIHHIGNVHKYAREEDRPERTLFVITTDGMENSSRIYTYEKVRKMVERQKEKYGWEFLFLGANIDAIEVAGRFGIAADRAVNYECDHKGTAVNFNAISSVVSAVRWSADSAEVGNAIYESCAPIRDDYKRRHKK